MYRDKEVEGLNEQINELKAQNHSKDLQIQQLNSEMVILERAILIAYDKLSKEGK